MISSIKYMCIIYISFHLTATHRRAPGLRRHRSHHRRGVPSGWRSNWPPPQVETWQRKRKGGDGNPEKGAPCEYTIAYSSKATQGPKGGVYARDHVFPIDTKRSLFLLSAHHTLDLKCSLGRATQEHAAHTPACAERDRVPAPASRS